MQMMRLIAVVLSLACLALGQPAAAQDKYPSKPVKIVLPYGPGSATDIITRILAEQLRVILGQSFVVENKPGAFGILAIEDMARSRADGYTLQVGNVSTNAITPVLFANKFTIDYEKDVVPVSRLADLPTLMVTTTKDFPPKTMAEFVAYAKSNPEKLNVGHAGLGSVSYIGCLLLHSAIGISRSDSLLTRSPRAFGPRRLCSTPSAPRSANRFCTASSLSPLLRASASLSTIACGVPAGTNTA